MFQVWWRLRPSCQEEERHPGIDGDTEGLAERAQEEPLPHQGGENYAGHHHQDDPHTGTV